MKLFPPSLLRVSASSLLRVLLLLLATPLLAREPETDAARLIPWLLSDDRRLNHIPFADVIFAATGHKVLPVDRKDPVTQRLLAEIGKALNTILQQMNRPDAEVAKAGRINEASRFFEDALRETLDGVEGLKCDFPRNAKGQIQRAGYPDLRLLDRATGRVFYLDPKLYVRGSRASTFRTFYYEPKTETSKVLDDACHLIVGIEHTKLAGGRPHFERWELIDVSGFFVRLKAEFEGSNRDLYRPEAVVSSGSGVP